MPLRQDDYASSAAMLAGQLQFPHAIRFGRDYWLARCAGYRVEWPGDRGGVVEEVRFGSRHDRPDFLVVRVGRVIGRRLVVHADEVASISPREQRLLLSAAPPRLPARPE